MKADTVLKIVMSAICFFFLVFFGMYLTFSPNVETLKITGVDYSSEEIIVEINGEVKKPGKYSVPLGTRVHDAIYMAGGITKDGDPESVDLSALITKECTITVEKAYDYDAIVITRKLFNSENRCNINTASVADLVSLPGIGESIASDIVNYRKVNGDFKTTTELKNIKGIGDKKYNEIKDLITVGG